MGIVEQNYLSFEAAQAHRALEQKLDTFPLVRTKLARQLRNYFHFIVGVIWVRPKHKRLKRRQRRNIRWEFFFLIVCIVVIFGRNTRMLHQRIGVVTWSDNLKVLWCTESRDITHSNKPA